MQMLVNIDVPELRPAIDFYSDGLGLALPALSTVPLPSLSAQAALYIFLKTLQAPPLPRQIEKFALIPGTGHRYTAILLLKALQKRLLTQ